MSIEEYTVNTQVKNGFKNNNTVGLVLLIPIFIIVIVFMIIPLFNTFLRSFTNYNLIDSEFVKLSNYKRILSDEIAITSINNTIISTLSSIVIAVSFSFLFAWLSSKIHKNLRYILSIMFLVVSVTSILPIGLFKIFSADIYGYMNAFLLANGKESIAFLKEPFFIHLLIILLPSLLGIGPLYLIFTIYFMNRDDLRKYFHFAVSLQIIIISLSFLTIKTITGFPSIMYMAHTLNTHVWDYLGYRYELGYGSSLLVILGLILAMFLTVCNGVVWLAAYIIKSKRTNQAVVKQAKDIKNINTLVSVIIFVFLLCISITLMYPFLQAFLDSFKRLDEFFTFPPKIFVINPTFDNYKGLNNILNHNIPLSRFLFNSVILVVISTILLMIVSIISSIGLSLLSTKIKKPLLLCLTFTFVLSPVILMSFDHYNFNSIMSIVMPLTFKTASFGLSIYLSSKILDNCLRNYSRIRDFLTSSKDIVKYLLSILSVSLIASLSTWFNLLYYPNTSNKWSLIHITQYQPYIWSRVGVNSSLYILSMIIPIAIIIICTPLLIKSLTKDDIE